DVGAGGGGVHARRGRRGGLLRGERPRGLAPRGGVVEGVLVPDRLLDRHVAVGRGAAPLVPFGAAAPRGPVPVVDARGVAPRPERGAQAEVVVADTLVVAVLRAVAAPQAVEAAAVAGRPRLLDQGA